MFCFVLFCFVLFCLAMGHTTDDDSPHCRVWCLESKRLSFIRMFCVYVLYVCVYVLLEMIFKLLILIRIHICLIWVHKQLIYLLLDHHCGFNAHASLGTIVWYLKSVSWAVTISMLQSLLHASVAHTCTLVTRESCCSLCEWPWIRVLRYILVLCIIGGDGLGISKCILNLYLNFKIYI